MIKEIGKVIAIKQIDGQTYAEVECISKSACSSCHSQDSCGVGAMSKAVSSKIHSVTVACESNISVDQQVELQIYNGDLLKSAILAYLVPLLFFLAGALISQSFLNLSEIVVISSALIMGGVGVLVSKKLAKKWLYNSKIELSSQPR
ncbi:MAG TPA: transcriptional regulator [Psychromonas hadalis]|nr:transcriptional regulator [Psychromonas hadalis]